MIIRSSSISSSVSSSCLVRRLMSAPHPQELLLLLFLLLPVGTAEAAAVVGLARTRPLPPALLTTLGPTHADTRTSDENDRDVVEMLTAKRVAAAERRELLQRDDGIVNTVSGKRERERDREMSAGVLCLASCEFSSDVDRKLDARAHRGRSRFYPSHLSNQQNKKILVHLGSSFKLSFNNTTTRGAGGLESLSTPLYRK